MPKSEVDNEVDNKVSEVHEINNEVRSCQEGGATWQKNFHMYVPWGRWASGGAALYGYG